MSASRLFSSPEEQAVCAVSLANYGVFTEHQGGGPLLRTGEFAGGENEIITNFIFHYNNHLKMTPTIQAWIMTPTMDWVKKLQKVRKNWHIFYSLQKFPRLCMSNPVHLSVVKLMIPDISPFSRQTYNRKVRNCQLCLMEKTFIMLSDPKQTLNKRNEIVSKCRHRDKVLLKHWWFFISRPARFFPPPPLD